MSVSFNVGKLGVTWSQLAVMKLCTVLPESRGCYKLFINNILWLRVKSFILGRWDSSLKYRDESFPCDRFSPYKWVEKVNRHILSIYNQKKMYANLNKYLVENRPDLHGWNLISPGNRRVWNVSWLNGFKFYPSKPGLCNHHLSLYLI